MTAELVREQLEALRRTTEQLRQEGAQARRRAEQLRAEHEVLWVEHEALWMEHEQLRVEHEQLRALGEQERALAAAARRAAHPSLEASTATTHDPTQARRELALVRQAAEDRRLLDAERRRTLGMARASRRRVGEGPDPGRGGSARSPSPDAVQAGGERRAAGDVRPRRP